MAKKKNDYLKTVILIVLISAFLFIAHHFGWTARIKDVHIMQEWLQGFGFWAYAIFILLYIVVAVFMLPAAAFTIAAGITFGPVLGGILSLFGATIGATVAFLIAKYAARDMIVSKFSKNPIFKKIEEGVLKNGTNFLILTRLVPLFPYNLQNYAYGITPMNVWVFAFTSLITMAPGAFIYAYIAGEIVTNGVSLNLLLKFCGAGFILFLVSLIPKYIVKKKKITL